MKIVILRLIEILRRMSPDTDEVNMKLLQRCRLYYANDPIELQKIDDFEKNYTSDQAILCTNEQVALMYSGYRLNHSLLSFESVLFVINVNKRRRKKSPQKLSIDNFTVEHDIVAVALLLDTCL
ncbi:hypothetical protein I4U23_019907 [Adineta vaga]|nr:hypothetical protein I4U23_019907 [Adineta vaga]